jgi:uncharacterized protein (UPF0332 family)
VPDRNQHLLRAEGNESLARSQNLNDSLEVDWAITMLFYSALHYIDGFLAGKNFHPRDHDARDSEVGNNGTLSPIYNDYRKLKDASRSARYDIANFDRSQFPKFDSRFTRIKSHVSQYLG